MPLPGHQIGTTSAVSQYILIDLNSNYAATSKQNYLCAFSLFCSIFLHALYTHTHTHTHTLNPNPAKPKQKILFQQGRKLS